MLLFMNAASLGGQAGEKTIGYEERLFDRSRAHTIDIVTDDWEELLENATSETYYSCAVVRKAISRFLNDLKRATEPSLW